MNIFRVQGTVLYYFRGDQLLTANSCVALSIDNINEEWKNDPPAEKYDNAADSGDFPLWCHFMWWSVSVESEWIPQSVESFSHLVDVIPGMLTLDEEAFDIHWWTFDSARRWSYWRRRFWICKSCSWDRSWSCSWVLTGGSNKQEIKKLYQAHSAAFLFFLARGWQGRFFAWQRRHFFSPGTDSHLT